MHFGDFLIKRKKRRIPSDERTGLGISLRDMTGELSSYDNHPGDLGNETFEARRIIHLGQGIISAK